MKILLSWLNEYGDFADPSDAAAVARLADTMTSLGLAVDGYDTIGTTVAGVITAQVKRLERHPEAAKVQRVYVDQGDGVERHVWCGAFNMQPGDVVPMATLGTRMPDGRTIERRGILGIDSEGMLCSADELGLGSDHSGIKVLPVGTPLGLPYGEALGLVPDILFDLDITRNRPDCWGYVGVARDVAAQMGIGFRPPNPTTTAVGSTITASVELLDGERCGRFTSTVMSGVRIRPSAEWMQRRLDAAGMRAISNVVDVSNYVMLELNQPNHAYDLDALGGGGFRIRTAADGEQMTTLDGETRTFTAADLLICDANDRPIGVGGVMGGLDTEITDATTTVALEVAWFQPLGVMQTASRLGLRSEASARYERGCDPYVIDTAIARFAELLSETCPELVVHAGSHDARGAGLPEQARSVMVRVAQVNRILDTNLSATDLPRLLDSIGYTVSGHGDPDGGIVGGTVEVALPTWRPDSEAEIDVIEEVARHYGYANLGKTIPKSTVHGGLTLHQQRRRQLREVLIGLGLSEAMPNPFLAPDTLAKAGLDGRAISITNPLAVEESVLRTSLRPGLLDAVAFNASHRRTGVKLFEIGHVYPPGIGELPDEFEALCVVLAGDHAPAAMAVWREIADALGIGARVDQARVPAGLHQTRSATLQAGKGPSGAVGEIDPAVLRRFNVDQRVAILELNLDEMLGRAPRPLVWKPVSRMPSSDLDLAFVVSDEVPAEKLEKAIRQGAGNLLVGLELFDVFRGAALGDGRRSLAYHLRLQASDRSLTDADIAGVRSEVIDSAGKFGAELRS